MDNQEFETYVEENSRIKDIFWEKALAYQNKLNDDRQPAKKWNDAEINRAIEKMYVPTIENIYEKVQSGIRNKHATPQDWQRFIDDNELFDNIELSMADIEFE